MVALAGAMFLTSCNVDEDIQDNGNGLAVKFMSGITALPTTKVAIDPQDNSVWETGDPVGIYMVENGTATVAEGAQNIRYTAAVDGIKTSFTPGATTIYYPLTGSVDFIAYYPHNATVAGYVYPVNVADQTSQTAIDLMYAPRMNNGGAGYDKSNTAPVNFTFVHQLVKLIMNVTKDPSVTGNITAVSINGMNTTAAFDLKGTGGLTGNGAPASITPCAVDAGVRYEAILLPVAALGATHTVTFTAGADSYTWKMSDNIASLVAGNLYTFDVLITKHAVNVSGSIKKWETTTPGSGIAE